jgi:sugar/nucleoside kinase (ribokinase family)
MLGEDLFSMGKPPPVIVGTGLVALDVVIPGEAEKAPRLWAGGTCGNVLTVLAYLGWEAYPVARLGQDNPSQWVAQDLATCGVHLDFLQREPGGATPVIVQHIQEGGVEGGTHSFSWRCPFCGSDLPRYRPLRLSDLDQLTPQLPHANVFFFDRVSPAALRLAEHYATRGALVVLEPSGIGDQRLFRNALALVHVLKFSHERLGGSDTVVDAEQPWLVVETLGRDGLRYRGRHPAVAGRGWQHLSAIPAPLVLDTAGSGDWCTAGILHSLGRGMSAFRQATRSLLVDALRFGQTLAACNCGFEGARGGMYCVSTKAFADSIGALMGGQGYRSPQSLRSTPDNNTPQPFACPSCPPVESPRALG